MNQCIICLDNCDNISYNNFCDCKFKFHSTCYFKWLKHKNIRIFRCIICNKRINKPHYLTSNCFNSLNNYLGIRKKFLTTKNN